jgi:hypothetical protein
MNVARVVLVQQIRGINGLLNTPFIAELNLLLKTGTQQSVYSQNPLY